ncbi:MAG TPA: FAD-dependent oxidoreductase [Polyangiaceae bacterium]
MSGATTSRGRRLRVAVVGAGPAGYYTTDFLLRQRAVLDLSIEVDLFERLPSPHGLVRSGVAPDHQSIKKVTKAFDRIASDPRTRYFGNVTVGTDLTHAELMQHYDQVVYTTGAATDRKLGVEGEELAGSHAATAFVGWYNGHPDFTSERVDLSTPRAVVVGLGNVAMDVARVLIQMPASLASTDITDYALEALSKSQVREVVLLGRRGPAEAAFSPREIQDIDELEGVELTIDQPESTLALDATSFSGDARKNVEFLQSVALRTQREAPRRVRLRFLSSPVALEGTGQVERIKLERNRLVERQGRVSAAGTGEYELMKTGLVLRSIGYFGSALPGVPFDTTLGVICNDRGRVTATPGGAIIPRLYVAGWIKRGPVGLIGTNKTDAKETVDHMLADVESGPRHNASPAEVITKLLNDRGVRVVSYADWRHLDELEVAAGIQRGKVREKFWSVASMLQALDARAPVAADG